jgi:hypothetical protein
VDTTSCAVTLGPLAAGGGSYFARAWDPAGNQRETPLASLTVYVSLQ